MRFKKPWLQRWLGRAWYTLVALVVLLAILMTALRLMLPLADRYSEELQSYVGRQIGLPMYVGSLHADWRGLTPEIELGYVRVLDAEGLNTQLRIRELEMGLDVWRSLWRRELVLSRLTVRGTRLLLSRDDQGDLNLRGIATEQGQSARAATEFFDWLLAQRQVDVESSEVIWRDARLGEQHFQEVSIRLRNEGQRHQIDAEMALPESMGERVRLAIEVHGELLRPRDWVGKIYGKLSAVRPAIWDAGPMLENVALTGGVVDAELWGEWRKGDMQSVQGKFTASGLRFGRRPANGKTDAVPDGAAGATLSVPELRGGLEWWRQAGGWHLSLSEVRGESQNGVWPDLTLELDADRAAGIYKLTATQLDVRDAASAALLFLDENQQWPDAIKGLRPHGRLSAIEAEYRPRAAAAERVRLRAGLSAFSNTGWHGIPAFSKLNARLDLGLEGGNAVLDGEDFLLDFDRLFREPLRISRMESKVSWRWREGVWHITAPDVLAITPHVSTRGSVDLRFGPETPPVLDLVTRFSDADGRYVPLYLPAKILGDGLVEWLDHAFVNGHVPGGGLIFRGPLAAFPFKQGEGKFEVRFEAENVELNYQPGWPRIHDLDAQVVFAGDEVHIETHEGYIFDSRLRDVRAAIKGLDSGNEILSINGAIEGATEDALRYLREADLGGQFKGGARHARASGNSKLKLSLRVPLGNKTRRHDPRTHIKGEIEFLDTGFSLPDWRIDLSKLKGVVQFDEQGFEGKDLRARFDARPIHLAVSGGARVGEEYADTQLRVDARAELGAKTLRKFFDHPWLGELTGQAEWEIGVSVPAPKHGEVLSDLRLSLASDLRGLAVALPEPFHKVAAEAEIFELDLHLPKQAPSHVNIRYGDRMSAALELTRGAAATGRSDMAVTRGAVLFGGGRAALPREPGLTVSGNMFEFSRERWQALLESGSGVKSGASDVSRFLDRLRTVKLDIGSLDIWRRTLDNVVLNARKDERDWVVDIESEQVTGSLRLPPDWRTQTLRAELENLAIEAPYEQPGEQAGTPSQVDPRDLPALSLHTRRLSVLGAELGEARFEIERADAGLYLQTLSIESEHGSLQGSGEWRVEMDEAGEIQQTRVKAELDSKDIGALLGTLGYRETLAGGHGKTELQLRWRGGPADFDNASLAGTMEIEIWSGRMLEVSPGAGRMLGLLSLQTLPRRLLLDFRDLFQTGFSFDRLAGHFLIEAGDAFTTDMVMEGPAARIDVNGRTGLAARDYNQVVTVTPRVTSSLPLAGYFLGGPPAAAAIIALDQMLRPAIDKATKKQYSLTGSWEEPLLEPLAKPDPAEAEG